MSSNPWMYFSRHVVCLSGSTASTSFAAYEILARPKGLIPAQFSPGQDDYRTVAKVNDGEEGPIVPATTVLKKKRSLIYKITIKCFGRLISVLSPLSA